MERFGSGSVCAAGALLALAACSGGGSTETDVPVYESFGSDASVTSELAGPVLRSSASGNEVIAASGTLRHDTGRIVLDLGNYVLDDPDGFGDRDGDGLAELSDGTVTIEVIPGFEDFDFVRFFGDGEYTTGGTRYLVNGIFGIATAAADMPLSGTATYSGPVAAILVPTGGGEVEQSGTTLATVDFGGTLDLRMTFDDTAVDGVGTPVAPALDEIAIRRMGIAGNSFSGGTITVDFDDGAGDPVGTVRSQRAEGRFFGYDAARRIPDEIGGVVIVEGAGATIAAGFVAD